MSKLSDEIRRMFKEGDDIRDAGLTTPEDVVRYDDILYGTEANWQVLDVYRPKNIEGKLPVIISVHGGGWVYGDKERYQYYCMDLARRGFAVVNFTYRLAPEFKYPAPLEDVNLVATWVLENSEKYGFSNDLFAVGDSAGAHLLGLYSGICTNPEYAKEYTFNVPENFKFKAIVLNCGAFKMELEGNDILKDFLPEEGSTKEMELINVLNHVTEDFPPTFVATSTGDFLKDQGSIIIGKLIEKQVPCQFRLYGDKTNVLFHVFHLNIRTEDAKICNDDECDFFKSFVGGKK